MYCQKMFVNQYFTELYLFSHSFNLTLSFLTQFSNNAKSINLKNKEHEMANRIAAIYDSWTIVHVHQVDIMKLHNPEVSMFVLSST